MGVKTSISLQKLNQLFPSYRFSKIIPTKDGIMDTTYIVQNSKESYILKHYERDIKQKIILDAKLLKQLKGIGLNVSTLLDANDGWYIYTKLKGLKPTQIKTFHIQSLARFLAKMHNYTYKKSLHTKFVKQTEIKSMLYLVKQTNYYKYKKFVKLQDEVFRVDGVIHGDIFKDNTVFDDKKIGIFDFSDSADGSFVFDAGVSLFGFDVRSELFLKLFLKSYNQQTNKKLTLQELKRSKDLASMFYGLKRIF